MPGTHPPRPRSPPLSILNSHVHTWHCRARPGSVPVCSTPPPSRCRHAAVLQCRDAHAGGGGGGGIGGVTALGLGRAPLGAARLGDGGQSGPRVLARLGGRQAGHRRVQVHPLLTGGRALLQAANLDLPQLLLVAVLHVVIEVLKEKNTL